MGILDKVLHRTDEEARDEPRTAEPECPHTALSPHWDKLEDMGKPDLATYRCESCSAEFTAEEAKLLMEQAPEVLAETVAHGDKT